MKTRVTRFLLVLCVLGAGNFARSQEPPTHDQTSRRKVGLVLEGGGALGLAHIGVITWLEEHRIPVSYVTGTSMGGLVGGSTRPADRPRRSGNSSMGSIGTRC